MASCTAHGEWPLKYLACPKCFAGGDVRFPIRPGRFLALEGGFLRRGPSRASLFIQGAFTLHSGGRSAYKIECDALTDEDIATLAALIAHRLAPFGSVEGVPHGGTRLAAALLPYVERVGPLLIVDDVLTTGASMEKQRAGREAKGAVIFARGKCLGWATPLFWSVYG